MPAKQNKGGLYELGTSNFNTTFITFLYPEITFCLLAVSICSDHLLFQQALDFDRESSSVGSGSLYEWRELIFDCPALSYHLQ